MSSTPQPKCTNTSECETCKGVKNEHNIIKSMYNTIKRGGKNKVQK